MTIDRTILFLIPNPQGTPKDVAEVEFGEEEFDSSIGSEIHKETAHELLYEEIYSRLFNPLFSIRIG